MHRGPISLATHKNPIGLLCFCSDRQKIRPLIVFPEHTANFFVTVTPLTRIIIILYFSIFIYYQLVYYIYTCLIICIYLQTKLPEFFMNLSLLATNVGNFFSRFVLRYRF